MWSAHLYKLRLCYNSSEKNERLNICQFSQSFGNKWKISNFFHILHTKCHQIRFNSFGVHREILHKYCISDYDPDFNGENEEDDEPVYEEPVNVRHAQALSQFDEVASTIGGVRYDPAPTTNSVTEFSIGNAVNLRGMLLFLKPLNFLPLLQI